MGDKSAGEGQPPPSPLTGAYLLIVLPQTHQQQHKDNVIHNLTKGLLTWDKNDCHVDLEKELQTIAGQAPDGEEAKNGERLIQFASENLVTEVLIHPQLNTLVQCMRNLLSSFTRHRHIIHAGYTCTGNGAWLLQDGTYSYADFAEMYQEHEVQRVLRAYENTVTVDFHCLQEGDWNNLKGKDPFSKNSRVRLNPKDCMTSSPALKGFLDFLAPYVSNGSIEELLESSDVVGNIRFSHPTLYVFPGGQGDAALFGINGFNMLVDGGFARKACFWDFSRHLDRLDAVLMTRLNNGNVQGMTSLLQRKRMENVYPQIGHFFCNLQERKHPLSPDGDKDKDPLLVSLFDQGHDILGSLRHLQLKPQPCYRDPMLEPVNLYHKVGHGKLDMYVISPAKDSREVREFMAKWTTQDSKIFCSFTKRGGEFQLPLCNKVSICALLVWQPANPEDNITRLLFPGSTPQNKIFEGLDRLKNLEFMKHPVCSARTLSPSPSSVGLNIRTISKPKVPASVDKIIENEDKKIEAVKQPIMKPPSGQVEKPQPKPTPPVSRAPSKQKPAEKPKEKPKTEVEVKSEKPETAKTEKAKPEKIEKTEAVQKIEKPKEKPKRPITKQPERKKPPQPVGGEKKDSLKSSPTTPKKIAENKITESKISDTKTEAPPKPEVKSRASSRTKPSPSATPAKSAKEANNRKVLEQKKEATKRVPLAKKDDSKKPEKPAASRKSAPSPSRADKQQLSPVKAPRPVTRPKQDAKKPIKTEKDALPESVVSTPSTVDVELAKAKEDLAEKETKVEDAKVEEVAEAAELPSFSRDEEDEILVVEKIEIEGDDKDKPEESIAVHIRKSREDIADGEEIKEGVAADQQSDEKKELMKTSDITIPDTDSKHLSEDVQDLTKDAPDTSKSRVELLATEEASLTKEPVTDKLTPKEKDAKEKSTDVGDVKQTDESQPDEKFSTTVESGATTAPTLPEDERIPLDEIKEQIEEKHVKEETKEKEVGAAPRPEQPTSLPQVPVIHGMPFDQRVHLLKDIVKTPDEVADLPMHEEADGGIYGVDNGGPLCKELHKTKDDLLNIPAKKPTEKKEDEEVKLVKDENEKEDATKDLKEDDAPLEDKAAPSIIADAKEEALGEKESKPEKEADQKPLDTLAKQDSGLEQDIDDEEIKELEHIDNELTKSSAVPPVSQEEDEVLDEDKDKETEKEKLLRKETEKDVEEIEEKADKEKPVGKEETANVEVKEKEGVEEKEPITTGSSQEGEKEVVDSAVDRKASIEEGKSPQAINEEKQIDDANGISEESKGKDEIVVTAVIESPEPQADENKLSMSPSPQPETAAAKSPEPQKLSKSPSPEPTAAIAKSPEPEKLLKSPSPVPVDTTKVDQEKSAKSPSPEPQIEAVEVEQDAKAPSPVLEAQPSGEEKSSELAPETQKSPSPGNVYELVESPGPSGKISEAAEDSVQVNVPLKSSKSPSPQPTADPSKDESSEIKSPSPEPQVKSPEPEAKSPSPKPMKDSDKSPEKAKSPSPEPQLDLGKSLEPSTKPSKSPSPEPQNDAAKPASPDKGKSPEPEVKLSESPSSDPKEVEEIAELEAKISKTPTPEPLDEVAKSPEPAAKISKPASPEPQADAKISKSPVSGATPEEAKSQELTPKLSKSPSPEPKASEGKELETTDKPECTEPKSDEAEPIVVDTGNLISSQSVTDHAGSPEPATKLLQSPSPEPSVDLLVKSPEPETKGSKSTELLTEISKSPEQTAQVSKSPSPELEDDKSKVTELIATLTSADAKVAMTQEAKTKSPSPEPDAGIDSGKAESKASKSPSPEPTVIVAQFLGTEIEVSKLALTEPIEEAAMSLEPEEQVSKVPSPDCKGVLTKSPEPTAKDAPSPSPGPEGIVTVESKEGQWESTADVPASLEAEIKASKSPSPELIAEVAKSLEPEEKPPSPDTKVLLTKSPEPTAKDAPSPSTGPEGIVTVESKEGQQESTADVPASLEAEIKASKSPSPEPIAEVAKSLEPEEKLPSPDTKVVLTKLPEPTAKDAPSPSPGSEGVLTVESKEGQQESATDVPVSLEAEIRASKSPTPEPIAEVAKSLESEEKLPSPDTKVVLTKSPEPTAEDAPSPSPGQEGILTVESKERQQESTTDVLASLEAEKKASKSSSPEPIAEVAKYLDPEEKPPSPDSKEVLTKSPEPTARDVPSPSPGLEEILTVESKECQQESTPNVPASLDAEKKVSKSPEPIAEVAKSLDIETKASKTPSPELTAQPAKLLDADIQASSTQPTSDEAKSADSEMKASKSPSPEPTVEKAKPLAAEIAVSKSPSPEPKPETASTLETEIRSSQSQSPETTADTAKVWKEPTGEPTGELAKSLEAELKASKSPSPEPIAETAKSLDVIAKASKSPSPELIAETTQSLEAEIKTSKSPSPEPETETAKPLEAEIKASKSSPEPTTDTAMSLHAKVDASKSPSPEPTVELEKSLEVDIKASKSPSPEPTVEIAKSSETKVSKSPSPEPTTEAAKSPDADIKTSKSPSPEPAESRKSQETDVKTSTSLSLEPQDVTKSASEQETKATESTAKSPSPEPLIEVGKTSPSPLTSDPEESKLPELAKDSKSPSPPPSSKVPELETKAGISKSPSPEPTKEIDISHKKDAKIESKEDPSDEKKTSEFAIKKEGKDVSDSKPDQAGSCEPKDDDGMVDTVESLKQDVTEESELVGRVQIDHEFDDLAGEMLKKDDKVPSLSLREASLEQHSEEGSVPKPEDKGPKDESTAVRKQSSGEVSTKSQEAEDKDVIPPSTSPVGSDRSEARRSGEISPLPKDSKSPSPEPSPEPVVETVEGADTVSGNISPLNDESLKDREEPSLDESKGFAKIEAAEPTLDARKPSLDASTGTGKGSESPKESKVNEMSLSESVASAGERKLSEVSLKESLKDEAVLLDTDTYLETDIKPQSPDLSQQESEKSEVIEVVLGKLIIDKEEVKTSVTETSKTASPEPTDVKLPSSDKKQLEEDSAIPDSRSPLPDEREGSVESEERASLKDVEVKSKSPSPEPKIDAKDETKSDSKPQEKSAVHTEEMKLTSLQSKSPSPTPSLSEKEGKHPAERETVSPSPSEKSTAGESIVDETDGNSSPHKVDEHALSPSDKKGSLKYGKLSPEISKSPSPPTVQDASFTEVDSKSPEPTSEKQEIVDDKIDSADVKPSCDSKSPEKSPFVEKKLNTEGISAPSKPSDESQSKKEESKSESASEGSGKDKDSDQSKSVAASEMNLDPKHEEKSEDMLGSIVAEIQSVIETAAESVALSSGGVLIEKTQADKSAISVASVLDEKADSKDTLDPHSKSPSPSEDAKKGDITSSSSIFESSKPGIITESKLDGEIVKSKAVIDSGSQEKPGSLSQGREESLISETELSDEKADISTIKEQLCFATSSADSKHPLESAEPLDFGDTPIAKVTAKESTEENPDELTSATITKAEKSGKSPEGEPDISSVAGIKDELQTIKDDIKAKQDELSALINGRSVCEHKLEAKILQDESDIDTKKSDTTVTDILDTAERIVSSLNGKNTIADESDYIPSFSETKSFALTIEGKKGPADEITVETKSLEDSSSLQDQDSAITSDAKAETVSDKTTQELCSGLNGHAKANIVNEFGHKEDTKVDTHIPEVKSDEKPAQSAQDGSSKQCETSSNGGSSLNTAEIGSSIEGVGNALSKVISDTGASISEKVSAIGSLIPGDILKSSTSSDKGSITASPELSKKSDDVSSTKQDSTKGLELKLDSVKTEVSGVLESVVSQGSEKSGDISGASSRSGEKLTETTDKKSSLSSTQVEPPTDKDLPVLSGIAALKKEFSSRSETPASDILSDKDIETGQITPFSDRSSEQVSRAITHVWETVEGRPESRHYDSDEDIPGSPMSISSHIPSPPQFEYDAGRPQDPMMMSSFYGSLPGDFDDTKPGDFYDYGLHDRGSDGSLKKELGDKLSSIRSSITSTPESSPLPERRFDPLMTKEPSPAPLTSTQAPLPSVPAPATSAATTLATAPPLTATAPSLPPAPSAQPPTTSAPSASTLPGALPSSSAPSIPDPIGKWDKPLGLPPPHSTDSSTPYLRWNPYKEWGKPLGLPSPAPPPAREDTDVEVDTSGGSAKTTPKKVARMNAENNKYNSAKETSNKRRSESPVKKPLGKDRKPGPTPVYMDLSYVPHHGNSNYATVEFFKRVRARYYVFSGTEPSKEVFNALLEAKQSWEDKDLEVTIIPTYDTDTLGYWIAENEETLSKLKIDLSPSASRCTINLQDHDTSCSAYRLEF